MLSSEEINELRIKHYNARYDLSFDESTLKLLNENPAWRTLFTWREGLGRTGLSLWGLRYFLPRETERTLRKALNVGDLVSFTYCGGTGMPVYSSRVVYDELTKGNSYGARSHYFCRKPPDSSISVNQAGEIEERYLARFGLDEMTKDELWTFNPNPDAYGSLARMSLTHYQSLINFINAPEWNHEL